MSRARIRRSPRREPQDGPGTRKVAAVGPLAVLVVAGALAWAAHAPAAVAPAPSGTTRLTAVPREFTCAAGLPGTRAAVGVAGRSEPAGLTVDGNTPRRAGFDVPGDPAQVHASAQVSGDAFAVRTASAKTWYAAGACPSPRSTWWFDGAGGSGGHHTELTLANPRRGDAIVDIDVFGPRGVVKAPGLDDVRIASGAVERFDLRKVAPAVGDLAVRVVASRGLVTASAADNWSAGYVQRPVLDWVTAQPPATRRVTVGGIPGKATGGTLLVANPTATEAVLRMSLIGTDGEFAPTAHKAFRVHPGAVKRVSLGGVLKAHPSGIRLHSQVPVTATVRVRQGSDIAYLPTVGPVGGSSVLGVPAHSGSARLVLFGAKGTRGARVVAYDVSGRRLAGQELRVRKDAAAAMALPGRTASVEVRGKRVSGALVLGEDTEQSIAVIPLTPTSSQARVPLVTPSW